MKLFIITILLCVGLTTAKSNQLEEGPQTFTKTETTPNASPSTETPKSQKRYAMKEIIMYLTPSQIKALNSGEGYITSQPSAQLEAGSLAHELEYLFHIRNQEELQRENVLLQAAKPIEEIPRVPLIPLQKLYDNIKPVEEVSKELIDPLSQKVYVKDNLENVENFAKNLGQKQLFYPDLQKDIAFGRLLTEQESKLGLQSGGWIPINPYAHIKPENVLLYSNQLPQLHNLENGHFDLNALPILPHNLEELASVDKLNLPLKYAPNFENIKTIQPLRLNDQHELQKQKTLAEIVAVANSLPVIAHSKIALNKNIPEAPPAFKDIIVPLQELIKNPRILSVSPGVPFYFSSIDLDKIHQ